MEKEEKRRGETAECGGGHGWGAVEKGKRGARGGAWETGESGEYLYSDKNTEKKVKALGRWWPVGVGFDETNQWDIARSLNLRWKMDGV